MIVPLFSSSDKTHLTNNPGDQMKWSVYLSLRYIDSTIRSKASHVPSILVALHPVPLKYHFKEHGKTTAVNEHQVHIQDGLEMVFEHIFHSFDVHFHTAKLLLGTDNRNGQCYHAISAWMADYFEKIHLHSLKQPYNPVCKTLKSSFGEEKSLLWQLRDYWRYFWKMILLTLGDAMDRHEAWQYLEARAVQIWDCIFFNIQCISPMLIIVPDILHTIYLCMLKYFMAWVTSFHQQHSRIDKFNQFWAMMPPYPGFAEFSKCCGKVTQWCCNEMKAVWSAINPAFVPTVLNTLTSHRIPFMKALWWVKILVYVHLMAYYR